MKLKLYRQKTREKMHKDAEGKWQKKLIYQGEDSHPYADDELLIVADGLGGRGGFPHTKANPEIINRDGFYDLVFAPVLGDEVSDEFKDYVTDNFSELFNTSEYYYSEETKNETVRRSGYFASRLVVGIALYALKYTDDFKKENVFRDFAGKSEAEKDELAMKLGEKLAKFIRKRLEIIAENVGFEMEVANKGAYLLPTTLTVALMNEREDAVDVLYLWAGDSRGYVWNVADGMAQVTEDHEEGETMTNLITLSRPFSIEGRFLTVKKPCAIFNASDGVYKPPSFICPIDQEYLFLTAVLGFADGESAMRFLEEQYHLYSPDDSSTLALYGCGYESYDDFREAVKERLAVIEKQYVKRLPGIFHRDYLSEYDALMKKATERFSDTDVAERLLDVPGILEIVERDMEKRRYEPYVKLLADATEAPGAKARADALTRKNAAYRELVKFVEDNWLYPARFKGMVEGSVNDFIDCTNPYRLSDALNSENVTLTKELQHAVNERNAECVEAMNAVARLARNPERAFGDDPIAEIERATEAFMLYTAFIRDVHDCNVKEAQAVIENRRARWQLQNSYIEHDRAAIDKFVGILTSAKTVDELPEYYKTRILGSKPRKRVLEKHEAYVKACEAMENVAPEEKTDVTEVAIQYWCGNKNVQGLIWNQYRELVPVALIDEIVARDPEDARLLEELKAALAVRETLYEEYNRLYFRDYRPTRLVLDKYDD